jgi:hypothetical protein
MNYYTENGMFYRSFLNKSETFRMPGMRVKPTVLVPADGPDLEH